MAKGVVDQLEEWRPIAGYPDYLISNIGRIMRIKDSRPGIHKCGRTLKPVLAPQGYFKVFLYNNKGPCCLYVHRLVLVAFVSQSPKGTVCNHKNGIKTDNRAENLEWVTRSENNQHSVDIGLRTFRRKLKNDEVWLIRKLLDSNLVSQTYIAKMFRIHQVTVSEIKLRKIWKHLPHKDRLKPGEGPVKFILRRA